jgi:hypothetical protein
MIFWKPDSGPPPQDLRLKMIADTEVFLNWALSNSGKMPRIPRQRVSEGGFSTILRNPGAKAMVGRFWHKALDVWNSHS